MLTYPCSSLCLPAYSRSIKFISTCSAFQYFVSRWLETLGQHCLLGVLSLRWPFRLPFDGGKSLRAISLPKKKHFSLTIRLAKLTGESPYSYFISLCPISPPRDGYRCTQTEMATADCLIFHRTSPVLLLHNSD